MVGSVVMLLATALEVARWRLGQISVLLDPMTTDERRRRIEALADTAVEWPSGAVRPISVATLYRWIRLFLARGLQALRPRRRKDKGRSRAVAPELVEKAIALLRERPDRPLYLVKKLLGRRGRKVSRSAFHRAVAAHPAYARIRARARALARRERQESRRRRHRRFQAKAPHEIWQLDAKGSFVVRIGRERRRVCVLTVLDDMSRAVLAAIVAPEEDLAAAMRVFRLAAARWGLPGKIYCDRHSAYDSYAFREALAELGVHRIRTRPRNAPARGKIEAYHRSLKRWFVKEIVHQVVRSLEHLEQLLLGAFVEVLYQDHPHRGIRTPPREALAGVISARRASLQRLDRALVVRKEIMPDRKTGEVAFGARRFRVPARIPAGQKVVVGFDPVDPARAFVVHPRTGRRLPLEPLFEPERPRTADERGPGRLQQLLDEHRGRRLPQAEAGHGLPEIFALLRRTLERRVPADEDEADRIQDFYRRVGPLPRAPLEAALARVCERLGTGRPLEAYLEALERRIEKRGAAEDES